jgi:phosphate transport system substrate-binding protein
MRITLSVLLVLGVLGLSCKHEPGSISITTGGLKVEVDESVYPAFANESTEFQSLYPASKVRIQKAEAREAVSDFAMDSVGVIVTARELSKDEQEAMTKAKIPLDSYKVALSAVAVIVNKDNPLKQIRMTELDSIFNGTTTRWKGGRIIEAYVGNPNSSVNAVFRSAILQGREFGRTIEYIDSSARRIDRVVQHPGAIALVGVAWLQGNEDRVSTLEVGGPTFQPDTASAPGQYFAPYQAYVYLGYYPISAPVYMYSRVVDPDISLGFISFVASGPGQKIIQNHGLVPATMPVRLVTLTSHQVN